MVILQVFSLLNTQKISCPECMGYMAGNDGHEKNF